MKKIIVYFLVLTLLCAVVSGCAEEQIDVQTPVESTASVDMQTEPSETEPDATVSAEGETTAVEPTITVQDSTEVTFSSNPATDEDEGNSMEIDFDDLLG